MRSSSQSFVIYIATQRIAGRQTGTDKGYTMIVNGLTIADADGLHEDGWCFPVVRLRLITLAALTELRVGVWMKPEDTVQDRTVFTITSDRSPATVQVVPFNSPTEISIPMTAGKGEEISLRISTPHRASRGEDARDLSFILLSLATL